MTHLLLIVTMLLPYAAQPLRAEAPATPAAAWAVIGGFVALPAGYAWLARRAAGGLHRRGGSKRLRRLDRATLGYHVAVLALLAGGVAVGGLDAVRSVTGDLVLVDEFVATWPALALLVLQWNAYYGVDRRLREATLIRRIDSGDPVYPVWSRRQYLATQARHHLALVLGPMLPLLAWSEWVQRLAGAGGEPAVITPTAATALTLAGGLTIFTLAPLLVVRLWRTSPLPTGEVRDVLDGMCRRAGVGVRDLLVWHSDGGVVNAAVLGLVAPVRYVLLSDGLLDQLERPQVEAVMAHELGHVKKKHMPTLALAALGSLGVIEAAAWAAADRFGADAARLTGAPDVVLAGAAGLTAFAAWLAAFGWVSRRIEREADVFAVRTLAAERGHDRVDEGSARQMIDALGRVAELGRIDPGRNSWRHGSIAWRQRHLASIVGLPVERLPIDDTMRRVRVAALLMIAATAGLAALP